MAKHAKLSPSSAHRWLMCPLSVELESKFPHETSIFAQEGTEAHALAEVMLKNELFKADIEIIASKEMINAVKEYVDYCLEIYHSLAFTNPDTHASIEEKLDLAVWIPEGFGTGDFIIVSGKTLHVFDLKYGRGVRVEANNNPQTRLYGLGAVDTFGWIYPLETVHMHIVQPRINSITEEVMSVKDLLAWGKEIVIPGAEKALSGSGEAHPGDWCKFCKARAVCKARAEYMISNIQRILGGKKDDR